MTIYEQRMNNLLRQADRRTREEALKILRDAQAECYNNGYDDGLDECHEDGYSIGIEF